MNLVRALTLCCLLCSLGAWGQNPSSSLKLAADAIQDLNPVLQVAEDYSEAGLPPGSALWTDWASSAVLPRRGIIWLRLEIENPDTAAQAGILYLHRLQEAWVYTSPNGAVDSLRAGTLIPASKRQTNTGLVLEKTGNSAQVSLLLVLVKCRS